MNSYNSGKKFEIVIGLCGSTASGKSTLAQELSTALGWEKVSFGSYVREIAKERGIEPSVQNLQQVGMSLINEGWHLFCSGMLAQSCWSAGNPLIIDGIRHKEAIESLRPMVLPCTLIIVFVDTPLATRHERLAQRGIRDEAVLAQIESHPTEFQAKSALKDLADIVVDGSKNVSHSVNEIIEQL